MKIFFFFYLFSQLFRTEYNEYQVPSSVSPSRSMVPILYSSKLSSWKQFPYWVINQNSLYFPGKAMVLLFWNDSLLLSHHTFWILKGFKGKFLQFSSDPSDDLFEWLVNSTNSNVYNYVVHFFIEPFHWPR